MKRPTQEFLEKRRAVIIADLLSKVEAEDWHGVADAAMDLREIDAQLPLLSAPASIIGHRHDFIYSAITEAFECDCGESRSVAEACR